MLINSDIANIFSKASQYKGVKRVGIFGSYARNEQSTTSDIDVLFEYYYNNDYDNGIDDTLSFLNELEENLKQYLGDVTIDFLSYNGLMQGDSKLLKQNIIKDAVWLYNRENL